MMTPEGEVSKSTSSASARGVSAGARLRTITTASSGRWSWARKRACARSARSFAAHFKAAQPRPKTWSLWWTKLHASASSTRCQMPSEAKIKKSWPSSSWRCRCCGAAKTTLFRWCAQSPKDRVTCNMPSAPSTPKYSPSVQAPAASTRALSAALDPTQWSMVSAVAEMPSSAGSSAARVAITQRESPTHATSSLSPSTTRTVAVVPPSGG
mmetsp:Transcript_12416/g.44033  ORF Transcript_12416/g.44033 Transcript_12416/m.44033 type:complete len:211 (+) Transcript_12416:54-686(+)